MAGVRTFEELDAWRLSAQLRDRIFEETQTGPAAQDLQFRDQLRDASRSAPRNIAEGFGAFRPREFARFTRIARRSLVETKNHLLDAKHKRYFRTHETADELLLLCDRATGATTGLLKYLERCNGKSPVGW